MTNSSSPKTFILDTNVILHDSDCINNFQEHDIVIPITVLEELDQFKKGNQSLNFHAREFVRALAGDGRLDAHIVDTLLADLPAALAAAHPGQGQATSSLPARPA